MAEVIQFAQFQVEVDPEGKPIELGRGGMGVTYRAFDTRLRRPVVLKVIRDGLLSDDVASKRFLREARSAARIQHPNIATVFDQGQEGNTFFYAMEFIEGETLQGMIRREGTLPPRMALEITLQVAKALQAAWAEKVIHRDIKPANIMLSKDKHGGNDVLVKLIDFGLAKGAVGAPGSEGDGAVTVTNDGGLTAGFVGTPHFASPEQIEPTGEIDIRSDIYSLGVTLWYALNGSPPFGGTSFVRVAAQHLSKPPPFADLKDAPAPVIALLRRMLAKDRDDRPKDPTELRHEIEAAIRALDSGAAPAAPNLPAPPMPKAAPVWPPVIGTVLGGRYQLFEQAGEDLTGRLFKAGDHQQGNRAIAVRAIRSGLLDTPTALERFQRNAALISQLNHPGLVGGVSLQQADGGRFATMEWLEARSLLDLLRARGGMVPPGEVQTIISQIASAAEVAASAGLDGLDLALGQVSLHLPDGPPPGGWDALLVKPLAQWPRVQAKINALEFSEKQAPPPMPEADVAMMTIIPGSMSSDSGASLPAGQRYTQRLGALAYELLGGAPHRIDPERLAISGYTSISAIGEEGNAVLKRALRPAPGDAITGPAQFANSLAAALPKRTAAPPAPEPPATPPPALPTGAPKLPAPPSPPPGPAPQRPPAGIPALAQPYVPTPAPAPAKSGNGALIGGIVGAVVVAGLIATAVATRKPKGTDSVNPTPTPSLAIERTPAPTEKPVATGNLSAEDQRAVAGATNVGASAYLAARKTESNPVKAWIRVADDFRLGSRPDESMKAFERAVALDPRSAEAVSSLAYAQLVMARFEEAERNARQATELSADLPAGWRNLGISSYLKLDVANAASELRRAISAAERAPASAANYAVWGDSYAYLTRVIPQDDVKPTATRGLEVMQRATSTYAKDADCWRILAKLQGEAGQVDASLESYQRALRIDPDYVESLNDLALAYSTAKQRPKSVETYQRALKINPNYPIVWNNLGSELIRVREYPKAIEAYQRALADAPNFVFALDGLADAFNHNQQGRLGLEKAKRATQLLPNFAVAWKTLSDSYRRVGEFPKSIEAAQKAIELAPYYSEAHEMLGAAYTANSKLEQGIASYQKAVEYDPQSANAWNRLGVAWARSKKEDKAFDCYQKAVKADPEAYEAWNNIGDIYKGQKKLQLAVEAYQKAVRINPKYAVGWNDLGFVLNDVNQDAAALDAYNKAVALDPEYGVAWNNIGYTYNKVGPQEKAIDPLLRAVKIDPNYAVAWNNLGFAYAKTNRVDDGISAYEKSVSLRPENPGAWNDLARLYDQKGNTAKAAEARRNATNPPKGGTPPPAAKPTGKNEFENMLRNLEQQIGPKK